MSLEEWAQVAPVEITGQDIINGVAAISVDLIQRVYFVFDLILQYVGPLAAIVGFSMLLGIVFTITKEMAAGRKWVIRIFYFYLLFAFFVWRGTEAVETYQETPTDSIFTSEELSVAIWILILMVLIIVATVLMIKYKQHGMGIQVIMFVGTYFAQYISPTMRKSLLASPFTLILGLVVVLVVCLLYVMLVK